MLFESCKPLKELPEMLARAFKKKYLFHILLMRDSRPDWLARQSEEIKDTNVP